MRIGIGIYRLAGQLLGLGDIAVGLAAPRHKVPPTPKVLWIEPVSQQPDGPVGDHGTVEFVLAALLQDNARRKERRDADQANAQDKDRHQQFDQGEPANHATWCL